MGDPVAVLWIPFHAKHPRKIESLKDLSYNQSEDIGPQEFIRRAHEDIGPQEFIRRAHYRQV